MTKTNNRKQGSKFTFVCIPRQLVIRPPIRHRGAPDDDGLSVFEFVVAATCVRLARAELNNFRHKYALSIGKKAINRERRHASKDLQTKIGGVSYQFKLAGTDGYLQGQQAFDDAMRGECFAVELSAHEFFRASGLARNGRSTARLPSTFERLTMGAGTFGPVLRQWTKTRHGRLRLEVEGKWVPKLRFARVAWPLPTSGATVLALYLFLSSTDQRSEVSIKTENLYRFLGIPLNRPAHAERALDRALLLVNRHLERLNQDGLLDECELPTKYVVLPIQDGHRLCFVAHKGGAHRIIRPNRSDPFDEEDLRQKEIERFRQSLNLADDDYLDDDEVEEIWRQQNHRREVDRKRKKEEETREKFQAMTAKLKAMK